MSDDAEANAEGVDFVLVAYREEGVWQLEELPPDTVADVDALANELRRWPGDGGSLGLLSVDEDFFLALRPDGSDIRLLVSDASAARDWPIAREALELTGESDPDEDDDEVVEPAGDLDIFADLGMDSMELQAVCTDLELYPDEMLGQIAARIGFGPQFDRAVDDDLT